MTNDFQVEFRDDHVHVQLGPEYNIDHEHREQFWTEIAELCARHGTKRVLVEGSAPLGEVGTGEVVDAGLHTGTVPKLWLAFHLENFQKTERTELYEAVASSRGVRVKFFADAEHALMWLRNNTPS